MKSRITLFVVILLTLLVSTPLLAQGNVQVWDARTEELPEEVPPPPEETIEAVASPEEAEDVRKQANEAATTKLGEDIDQNLVQLQAAMDKGVTAFDVAQDSKLRNLVIKTFDNNPLAKLTPEQIHKNILSSSLAPVFYRYPKLLDFMTNFLRHPKAFADLMRSLNRTEAWRNCFIASLILMVLVFFLKRRVIKPKFPWWKKFAYSACFSLAFMLISTSMMLITFSEEFAPTWDVISQTFF